MTKSDSFVDESVSAREIGPNQIPQDSVPKDDGTKGASLVEYCLLGAIIALTVMLAMPFLTQSISSVVVKGGSAVLIRP